MSDSSGEIKRIDDIGRKVLDFISMSGLHLMVSPNEPIPEDCEIYWSANAAMQIGEYIKREILPVEAGL